MTILAPGTPYYEAWCSVHGIVHEGTDFGAMASDLQYHSVTLGCPNAWFNKKVTPLLALEPLPTNGRSSEAQSVPIRSGRSQVRVLPSVPDQHVSPPQEAPGDERASVNASQSKSNKRDMGSPQALGFRGRLTATSWEPPKSDMHIEDWLAEVRLLWTLRDRLQWALGDSLLWGEARYGEMWSQVADQYNHHTLENCRWVASRFPVTRRRESLSFSHHEAVAKLEPAQQDAWLDRAEAEAMPRAELRKALRGEQPEPETHACPDCGAMHRIATHSINAELSGVENPE